MNKNRFANLVSQYLNEVPTGHLPPDESDEKDREISALKMDVRRVIMHYAELLGGVEFSEDIETPNLDSVGVT